MNKAASSRGARLAMLVAAFAATSAAFGLHPEPASASSTGDSPAIRTTAVAANASGTHECLACRAHRPLLSALKPSPISSPQRSALRRIAPRPFPVRTAAPSRCDSRAPPKLA